VFDPNKGENCSMRPRKRATTTDSSGSGLMPVEFTQEYVE